MSQLTPQDIRAVVKGGTWFSVGFHKRPKALTKRQIREGAVQPEKGPYREFVCRFGVRKDLSTGPKAGKVAFDRNQANVVTVWIPDEHRREADRGPESKGYRNIPCEQITYLKANGKEYDVQDGQLVERTV